MKVPANLAIVAAGAGMMAFVAWRSSKAIGDTLGSIGTTAGKALDSAVATAGTAVHAVNPLNPDNVFAGAVNKVGQAGSGDKYWTLGGWFYDRTHADAGAIATAPVPTIDFGRVNPADPSAW